MAVLALAPPQVRACWLWHLRFMDKQLGDRHPRGMECRTCNADVAGPADGRWVAVCIYCAMDQGIVPLEDVPPYD